MYSFLSILKTCAGIPFSKYTSSHYGELLLTKSPQSIYSSFELGLLGVSSIILRYTNFIQHIPVKTLCYSIYIFIYTEFSACSEGNMHVLIWMKTKHINIFVHYTMIYSLFKGYLFSVQYYHISTIYWHLYRCIETWI